MARRGAQLQQAWPLWAIVVLCPGRVDVGRRVSCCGAQRREGEESDGGALES